jgi:tRNA threonylcarbamoyladenosine biosynthesis protein TsaB
MLVLALDTTTKTGSLALGREGKVVAESVGDGTRTHAERLPLEIGAMLERQQLNVSDVDVFAVAAGPGSFTGLRIGIATIQGLAFAAGRPVVPVSALDALAYMAAPSMSAGGLIAVWMDAHRDEVFSALYRNGPGAGDESAAGLGEITLVDPPSVGAPETTLVRWRRLVPGEVPVRFIGDGARAYRGEIEAALGSQASLDNGPLATAPTIARLAGRRAISGHTVAPHAIVPVYVRRPDAVLARERQDISSTR